MKLDWNGIFAAVVPLYVAIGLAFASVRWWKIFTPEQCSGVNRYVAEIGIPFLVLDMLSTNNIYTMNFRVIAADAIQKGIILAILLLWKSLSKKFSFDWVITLFSLSTLPNNLLMGVPLLGSMYGESSSILLVQIVVVQGVIWFNVLMAMYEYRATMIFIAQQFPRTASSIASIRLEPEVVSLSGREPLETNAEIDANGKLNVVVRSPSVHSRSSMQSFGSMHSVDELNKSSATDTFPVQSSSRAELRNSSSVSGTTQNFHGMISNNNRVRPATFGIDVLVEPSDPSLQQETTPKSPTKNSDEGDGVIKEMPPTIVVIKLVLIALWRKLIRNSNTYASVVGIVWSLVAYRYNAKLPLIVKGIIKLLSKTGTGMAMFSLGLSIALQPKFIAGKLSIMVMSTALRFIVGPAAMAAGSAAVGLHGIVFQSAVIQAALPTAVVCFVYAKQQNVNPEIFSTSIIISTIIFLPVTIIYYVALRHYP